MKVKLKVPMTTLVGRKQPGDIIDVKESFYNKMKDYMDIVVEEKIEEPKKKRAPRKKTVKLEEKE